MQLESFLLGVYAGLIVYVLLSKFTDVSWSVLPALLVGITVWLLVGVVPVFY